MLLSYGVYIVILSVVIGTSLWFEKRRDQTEELIETLQRAEDYMHEADRALATFLSDETINITFYETKRSDYLKQWRTQTAHAVAELERLNAQKEYLGMETPLSMDTIRASLDTYEKAFEELVSLVLLRGFKDYGLEGKMRGYIHNLEQVPVIDKAIMLTCRRHEKDFFLRKQPQYIGLLKQASDMLKEDILIKTKGSAQDSLLDLVQSYQQTFVEVVRIEELLGFDHRSGVRGEIKTASETLSVQVATLRQFVRQNIERIKANNRSTLLLVISGGLLLSIFLALFIPQILSKPVRQLSRSIHTVIASNFAPEVRVAKIGTSDEISALAKDFSFMLGKMQYLLEEVRENAERVERKQTLLMDSIRYARQIQGAILPTDEVIQQFFPAHFLIYRPLHVVSGDFYWMTRKNGRIYVALADCTGHGVPGAFMSMIGHTLLNKILNQDHIYEPAAILEVLHIEVREALQQNKDTSDGMDIALFSMEYFSDKPHERLITYSGAKIPLFYTENGVFTMKEATKRSIGGDNPKQEQRAFQTHVLALAKGEYVYLASDGFADQNNEERTKFGKKNFMRTLERLCTLPLETQGEQLEAALMAHQGEAPQRDDISVVGLQL